MSPWTLPPEITREELDGWVASLAALSGLPLVIGSAEGPGLPVVASGEPILRLAGAAEDDPRLLAAAALLSSLCESHVARRDLVAQTARLWKELNFLTGVATALSADATVEETAGRLLTRIVRLLGVSRASILLAREDGRLSVAAARGVALDLAPGSLVPQGGIAERVLRSGQPMLVEDVDALEDVDVLPLLHRETRTRSFLSVPILSGGVPIGVVNMTDRAGERPFGADDLKLISALADQAGIAFANVRILSEARRAEAIRRELAVAARIQRALLLQPPISLPGLSAFGVCEPAAWVGGDAFQASPRRDGGIWAAVCDVSGQGLPAALLLSSAHAALRGMAAADLPPVEAARALHQSVLSEAGDSGRFVTAALLRADRGGRTKLASLGSPPVLLRRAGGAIEGFSRGGAPAGFPQGGTWEEDEVTLLPGDRLLLHTDGLVEAEGPSGPFGEDRLREVLAARPEREPAESTARAVLEALRSHLAGRDAPDDVTLLVVARVEEKGT